MNILITRNLKLAFILVFIATGVVPASAQLNKGFTALPKALGKTPPFTGSVPVSVPVTPRLPTNLGRAIDNAVWCEVAANRFVVQRPAKIFRFPISTAFKTASQLPAIQPGAIIPTHYIPGFAFGTRLLQYYQPLLAEKLARANSPRNNRFLRNLSENETESKAILEHARRDAHNIALLFEATDAVFFIRDNRGYIQANPQIGYYTQDIYKKIWLKMAHLTGVTKYANLVLDARTVEQVLEQAYKDPSLLTPVQFEDERNQFFSWLVGSSHVIGNYDPSPLLPLFQQRTLEIKYSLGLVEMDKLRAVRNGR